MVSLKPNLRLRRPDVLRRKSSTNYNLLYTNEETRQDDTDFNLVNINRNQVKREESSEVELVRSGVDPTLPSFLGLPLKTTLEGGDGYAT